LGHSERLALAEEYAQEALISILDRLNDFKGESKFTTWAFKFAVNISLGVGNRFRWNSSPRVRTDSIGSPPEPVLLIVFEQVPMRPRAYPGSLNI
jgi:RNA polymerase sigma-70 factor (ECF subfamily)